MSDNLPQPIEPRPLIMIQRALDSGIKPSDLKDLFDLQVRAEQREAEQRYADAVTNFQAWCPIIVNRKAVNTKGGGTAYKYAPFDDIMKIITPGLRENRIVISFDTAEGDGKMQVTCRTRVGVVEKHTTVQLPIPPAGPMTNNTQSAVSAVSYGKRCALIAALNLVCSDEDDDAVSVGDPLVGRTEIDQLDKLLEEYEKVLGKKVNDERFCQAFGGPECKIAGQLRRSQWERGCDDLRLKITSAKGGKS